MRELKRGNTFFLEEAIELIKDNVYRNSMKNIFLFISGLIHSESNKETISQDFWMSFNKIKFNLSVVEYFDLLLSCLNEVSLKNPTKEQNKSILDLQEFIISNISKTLNISRNSENHLPHIMSSENILVSAISALLELSHKITECLAMLEKIIDISLTLFNYDNYIENIIFPCLKYLLNSLNDDFEKNLIILFMYILVIIKPNNDSYLIDEYISILIDPDNFLKKESKYILSFVSEPYTSLFKNDNLINLISYAQEKLIGRNNLNIEYLSTSIPNAVKQKNIILFRKIWGLLSRNECAELSIKIAKLDEIYFINNFIDKYDFRKIKYAILFFYFFLLPN